MGSSSRAPVFTLFFILSMSVVPSSCLPSIDHVTIVSKSGSNLILRLDGAELSRATFVRTTKYNNECKGPDLILPGTLVVSSPILAYATAKDSNSTELFFCIGWTEHASVLWNHQGLHVLNFHDSRPAAVTNHTHSILSSSSDSSRSINSLGSKVVSRETSSLSGGFLQALRRGNGRTRGRREANESDETNGEGAVKLFGMRVETSGSSFGDDGIVVLLSASKINIRLFGENLTNRLLLALTPHSSPPGSACEFPSSDIFGVVEGSVTSNSAVVEVVVPSHHTTGDLYYLCVKSGNKTTSSAQWVHQGNERWLQLRVYAKLFPVWAVIITIFFLLCFSALFSGLTLGLMSLDKTDLKILANTGTELERKYAAAIMPVRSHGSLLLCSLLLGNVLVNSVLTILMDDITSGLIAVIFSTLAIVIFGEIMPQAFCSRHGLAVGAKTILITKFVIILTAIVAYPISKILDYMLGEEIGNVYNRERLNELVKTGTDIEKDEVNIISGALQLSKKTVSSVMTKLEDVFMLSYDTILDFETVSEIMNSGYSRVPVYDGRRSNIITLLFIKDLAFVDPDDNTKLKTLCDFYQNSCYFVFEDMTLDVLFKKFKEGTFGHMAFVQRVNSEGEGDPFYETLGLITLEDVIEELIQAEIVDETDVWTDNRSKRKREKIAKNKDFASFAEKRENQRIHITPHMTLATFQYLSTSVEPFKAPGISESILRRLLQQDVYRQIKNKNKDKELVYQQGKPADYFVLILEGRVEVLVGKENMCFESGPFTYFGIQALQTPTGIGAESPTSAIPPSATGSLQSVTSEASRHPFIPDYTVRATTELLYVMIKRSLYLAARRATLLQQSQKAGDHFDDEVDKLLHIDDDDRSQQGSQSSRRASRCDKESPVRNEVWPVSGELSSGSGANGTLPSAKSASESEEPEERTTLLQSGIS